jgi:tetratricopeptide (TPR) repeat protein
MPDASRYQSDKSKKFVEPYLPVIYSYSKIAARIRWLARRKGSWKEYNWPHDGGDVRSPKSPHRIRSMEFKMYALKSLLNFRFLAFLFAWLTLAACGQSEQPAPEPTEESTAEEVVLTEKVPVTTASAEARAYYEEGLALADNLHLVEANAAYARAVEADPNFAMGYLRLAQSSQTAAAFFRAVRQAEENAAHATEGEQHYIKALIAGAENDQASQFDALVQVMSAYPKDERTHMAVANYFLLQQNFADAAKHYGHATSINPEFAAGFNALGYAHRNNDDLEGAKAAFARYVELIPDEANPYDSYAELLMEMGEYDESIDNYRKALEIDKNFPSAYAGISINESLKGNAEAAQAAAAEMLAAARNNTEKRGAMFRSMTSHLYAGNVDAARTVSDERYAMAEAEGNHAAMGNICEYYGDLLATLGDGDGALEQYEKSLSHRQQSDTNDAIKAQAERTFLFKAAVAAMVNGDIDASAAKAAEFSAAVEGTGTGFEQRRMHEIDGYIAASRGDMETSAAELGQANLLDPIVLYYCALANSSIGNTEKAKDLANRAAYRNTLSGNLPFFRDEAMALLKELEAQ